MLRQRATTARIRGENHSRLAVTPMGIPLALREDMQRSAVFLALALCGCAEGIPPEPVSSGGGGGTDNNPAPTPPPMGNPLGTFRVGYYYLPYESDYQGANNAQLTDSSCNTIAVVPTNFAWDAVNAGAGRLSDGRVLVVIGACSCLQSPFCFAAAGTPWGSSSKNRPLVPFRSIASDGNTLEVGTRVYAPSLAGMRMPGDPPAGGFVHDGCLVVDDDSADHNHVDLFTGLRSYERTLSGQLATNLQLYPAAGRCP
jgi:hypothetical protein